MKTLIYDIEVYPNRMCLTYCDLERPDDIKIIDDLEKIKNIRLKNYKWIGFNIRRYDHPILELVTEAREGIVSENSFLNCSDSLQKYLEDQDIIRTTDYKPVFLREFTHEDIFKLSKAIIDEVTESFNFNDTNVDLYEICPKGKRCSLKEFGHRMKYPVLENLPFDFDKELSDDEWEKVKAYSIHDVKITHMLWNVLKSEQDARETLKTMYNIKLLGGAPKLAEKCIVSELVGHAVTRPTNNLINPGNLKLSPIMNELFLEFLNHDYSKGKPERMGEIDHNGLKITFGVGGIHAFRDKGYYQDCYDYDISSYYPSIILNCELTSDYFTKVYRSIYEKRIAYKKNKDPRALGLKLILNSIYGKFSEKKEYASPLLYAPHIGLNICLLGQFYLVDLAEKIGDDCIYINTDGIISKNPIDPSILKEFCDRTGFVFEDKKVSKILLKDVNSYHAEYEDGSIKTKSAFVPLTWEHNCAAEIINKAAVDYMFNHILPETTIEQCTDPFMFLYFKKAKKGNKLVLGDEELKDPKIRFWVSKVGKSLKHVTSKVNTSIAKDQVVELVMNTNECNMGNINRDFYIERAYELIYNTLGQKYESVI